MYKSPWPIGSRKPRELNPVLRSRKAEQDGELADAAEATMISIKINKTILKHIFIVFISSVLAACAGSQERPEDGSLADEPVGSDCISQRSVRDYRVLDDANLIVTASVNKKYHVLLSRKAMNLRSSQAIGFDSATSRICSKFSDLVVKGSFGPEKIRIASVRLLTPEDENDLLVRFGKKEPDYEEPRPAEEVDGAEVEELD